MKKNMSNAFVWNTMFTALFMVSVLAILLPTRADAGDEDKARVVVSQAVTTVEDFANDPNMDWLKEHIKTAKALLIVPDLLKGGFFLGGSGGYGVLLAKNEQTGEWSQPVFYSLGSVTFGIQFGGERGQMIVMIMSRKGVEKLLASSFKFGGDSSISAGPIGAGAAIDVMADFISFSRFSGAYAGISLQGSIVKVNHAFNDAYYGNAARPSDVLINQSVSNPDSEKLRQTVARYTR